MTVLELDSSTLAIVAIVFTLLGALISSIVGYYALKKQDERKFKHDEEKNRELEQKRLVTLYRRLFVITDRIVTRGRAGETVRVLSDQEYDTIESIIAENFDILANSTVAAWDTRNLIKREDRGIGHVYFHLQCEAFWADVKTNYERYKLNAIPPPELAQKSKRVLQLVWSFGGERSS